MLTVPADIASTINAMATVILVLVTAAYVFLTWGVVKETRQARKQEIMPVMNLNLDPISIELGLPKLRMWGMGPR